MKDCCNVIKKDRAAAHLLIEHADFLELITDICENADHAEANARLYARWCEDILHKHNYITA